MKLFFDELERIAFSSGYSAPQKEYVLEKYRSMDKIEIFSYAKKRKILPFIAKFFISQGLDISFWEEPYNYYKNRNFEVIQILKKVFDGFDKNNIVRVFVYENFGALLKNNGDIACFCSGDVDLFVDTRDKAPIIKILNENGFYEKGCSKSLSTVRGEFINPSYFESGFRINLMYKPISRTKLPFTMNVDEDMYWGKSQFWQDTKIKLPEKNLLMYLCLLHISVHGYIREPDIRLYIDIKNSNKDIDWNRVYEMSVKDNKQVRVLAAARIVKMIIGENIPDSFFRLFAKHSAKFVSLSKVIYDSENEFIKRKISKIDLLKIEAYSFDNGAVRGLLEMIFPNKAWMREYYFLGNKNLCLGYIKHIKNLF